jgi:RuvB-like protein 1 (pontin 52)
MFVQALTRIHIHLFSLVRYAVQMLTPARILAETCGREKVGASDVKEVDLLFKDAKQSAQLLARSEGWLK